MESTPLPKADPAASEPVRDDETPSHLLRRQYEVASVEKVAMPDGGLGGDWYRYVLASGPARITGLRSGTSEEVAEYAKKCADEFNLRNATGRSSRALANAKSR